MGFVLVTGMFQFKCKFLAILHKFRRKYDCMVHLHGPSNIHTEVRQLPDIFPSFRPNTNNLILSLLQFKENWGKHKEVSYIPRQLSWNAQNAYIIRLM